MNNIAFNGKTEVLYGLKQAAINARSAELCRLTSRRPRPVDRTKEEALYRGKTFAYADMAVLDESFYKTIDTLSLNERTGLKLSAKKFQDGVYNPILVFSSAIIEAAKKHSKLNVAALKQFFDKINL